MPDDPRLSEVAASLRAVRERIAAACRAAGRHPEDVHLIVVTKTYPAADVLRLAALGVRDVGENRDQEATPKAAEVAAAGGWVRWHFIGHLQRNKVRSVVRYASMVHSVDSVRLGQALSRAVLGLPPALRHESRESLDLPGADTDQDPGSRSGRMIDVLVQVSIDGDPRRGGAVHDSDDPDVDLDRVLDAVASAEGLRLRGLMAVAPMEWDPDRAFAELQCMAETVQRRYPQASVLSAGMSGDLEQAIAHGATHIRVGSAVLGERPPLR